MTPDGFEPFDGIVRSVKKVLTIVTTKGRVRTSTNHRFVVRGKDVLAVSVKPGDTVAKGHVVVSVNISDDEDYLYDPVNVGTKHAYIGSGIVHHNCDFMGSSGTLINGDKLQKLVFGNPLVEDEHFRVYAKPEKARRYIMTVDVSEGVDRDHSVASIIDVTEKPFRHVAVYRNNAIPPEMFTEVVYRLGKKYNDALAIIETNSIGSQVAKELWFEYEYENMVKTVPKETGAKVGYGSGSQIGVKTTKSTKRVGCSTFKSLIETDLLITNDYHAISEMGTFVMVGTSWGAEEGKNDDVVMSLVIFSWFTQQVAFEDYMAGNINDELRRAREEEKTGMPDFFIDDGAEGIDGEEDFSLITNRTEVSLF